MSTITCELESHSNLTHLQQIYTGFLMLHRAGSVRLRQRIVREDRATPGPQHLRDASACQLRVVVNGSIVLNYDTHDSWEIDDDRLAGADVYFKRSFAPQLLTSMGAAQRAKIRPLGLNYGVFPDGVDPFGLARSLRLERGRKRIEEAARSLALTDWLAFTARVSHMSAPPDPSTPAKVLFMTRAFDPHDRAGRSAEKVDECNAINEDRARLIRELRSELGGRFCGGFAHTPHAIQRYPDLLVADKSRGTKGGYIRQLRSFPICVATAGIHGSTGWKFAEYVAFSKAIVAEPMRDQATGDLATGRHYLEFNGADVCVNGVVRLMEDVALRRNMMTRNAAYYQRYLRPDRLVMNTLEAALAA